MTYICTIKLIKPIIMKVVAITINGYRDLAEKNVKSISTNGNSYTILSTTVIDNLVKDAIKSGQMQIYCSDISENLDGKIDGFDGTPLYTNGQISVEKLLVDDIVVWER